MSKVQTPLKPARGGALNRTAARPPKCPRGEPPHPTLDSEVGGRNPGGGQRRRGWAPGKACAPRPAAPKPPRPAEPAFSAGTELSLLKSPNSRGAPGGPRPPSREPPSAAARRAWRRRIKGASFPGLPTHSGTLFFWSRVSPAPSCTTNHLNISAQNPVHCGPHIKKCYSL